MTQPTANLTLSLARSGGASLGLSLSLSTGTSDAPPVVGSALWLDALRPGTLFQDAARTTVAGVGDPVGSWYDPDAGIGATQSGTARPVRATADLTFDGTQYLGIPSGLSVGGGQWTIFVVARMGSGNPGLFQFSDTDPGTPNTGPGIGLFSGTTIFRQVNGAADIASGAYPLGSLRVYAVRRNPASFHAFVNNNTLSSVGLEGTSAQLVVTLGRWYSGGGIAPLIGDLQAFLVYNSALSDAQVSETIAFLAARHGVAL